MRRLKFLFLLISFILIISNAFALTENVSDIAWTEDIGVNWYGTIITPTTNMYVSGLIRSPTSNAELCKIFNYTGTGTLTILATGTTNGIDSNFSPNVYLLEDTNYVIACGNADNSAHDMDYIVGILPKDGVNVAWETRVASLRADGTNFTVDSDTRVQEIKGITYELSIGGITDFNYVINSVVKSIDFNSTSIPPDGNTALNWRWTVDDLIKSYDENFVFTPVTEYTDYNSCLNVAWSDYDVNGYYCKTINSGKIYGDTNFYFFDEYTGLSTEATIDFNGTQYTGTSFYLPSRQITNDSSTNIIETFTITKANYGTRYYQVDINKFSDLVVNFAMLPDSNGTNTEFKFFAPDATTILTSKYIEVRNWAKDNNTVGRLKTDASGKVTFNLNLFDGNYHFIISDGEYDYNSVALTIHKPKDELTSEIIDANWNLTLSGLAAASFQNIEETSQALAIYANTLDYYILTISSDSVDPIYLSRKYEIQVSGNPETYSLQPYLPQSDESATIKLVTNQDTGTQVIPYPTITIKIYKTTEDGRSLVEQTITDSKGEAFVSLVAGDTYEFELYESDGTEILFNGELVQVIKVAGSTIYFTIATNQSNNYVAQYGLGVYFDPISASLYLQSVGSKNFIQTISNIGGRTISVTTTAVQNGVTLGTDSYAGSADNATTNFNIDWNDLVKGDLNVSVSITVDGNTFVFSKIYSINKAFGGYYDPIQGLRSGLREDLGCSEGGICTPLLALALIICTGLIVYVSLIMGLLGSQSSAILFLISMSLFTYLTWIPLELTIVVGIVVFVFIMSDKRGS